MDLDFGSSSCLVPSPSALSFLISSTLSTWEKFKQLTRSSMHLSFSGDEAGANAATRAWRWWLWGENLLQGEISKNQRRKQNFIIVQNRQVQCWAWEGWNGRIRPSSMWGPRMSLRITSILGQTIRFWICAKFYCVKITRNTGCLFLRPASAVSQEYKKKIYKWNQQQNTSFLQMRPKNDFEDHKHP